MKRGARARARANIALAKYWGKSDEQLNLPAVPSVSITLDPLITETLVIFDDALDDDRFELDGELAGAGELVRVIEVLDRVRALASISTRARVQSRNDFPTAAGLASSASGFAALVAASSAAAGLKLGADEASAMARRASASAARSIFGGFVALDAGLPGDDALGARQIAHADHWDLRVVVAETARGRKAVGSREAMGRSRASRYFEAWLAGATASAARIEKALLERDFDSLAPAVEESFLAMHAVAMTSEPPVLYWQPGSLAAIAAIRELRSQGLAVCATMDAGPHVKAVCLADHVERVDRALRTTEGVITTLITRPGPGVEVETLEL